LQVFTIYALSWLTALAGPAERAVSTAILPFAGGWQHAQKATLESPESFTLRPLVGGCRTPGNVRKARRRSPVVRPPPPPQREQVLLALDGGSVGCRRAFRLRHRSSFKGARIMG